MPKTVKITLIVTASAVVLGFATLGILSCFKEVERERKNKKAHKVRHWI